MNHCPVPDAAERLHYDFVQISAKHSPVKDGHPIVEVHVPDDRRARRNPRVRGYVRLLEPERQDGALPVECLELS